MVFDPASNFESDCKRLEKEERKKGESEDQKINEEERERGGGKEIARGSGAGRPSLQGKFRE